MRLRWCRCLRLPVLLHANNHYGLKAIWVNRGESGVKGNEKIKADFVIKNISELLEIF